MTAYTVELSPAAEFDVESAFIWYRERNALIADAFRAEVFDAVDAIGASPLGRPADDEGNRRCVLHRFPYSVFYEVNGHRITILAVAHHRRRPGY